MNVDIENSSIMSNFKDCRPADFNQSLFTNTAIQESTISKGGKKKSLAHLGSTSGGDHNMLTINKTQQERDIAKKKLQETYNQHVSKVQARKHTLSQGGATLSMRSMPNAS